LPANKKSSIVPIILDSKKLAIDSLGHSISYLEPIFLMIAIHLYSLSTKTEVSASKPSIKVLKAIFLNLIFLLFFIIFSFLSFV